MIQFFDEQDKNSKPPERQGEMSPEEDVPGSRSKLYWDGSQSELVSDDTALAFEEQHTGIKLTYILTSSEIFKALVKTQYTFSRKVSSILAVILSLVMGIYFISQSVQTGDARFNSLAAVCFMIFLVVLLVPSIMIKIHSAKIADGKKINMKIYPDHIHMDVSRNEWEIPLDGTSESVKIGNLIVIYIKDSFVILPLRCVEPAVLPEVQAMIISGTNHKI